MKCKICGDTVVIAFNKSGYDIWRCVSCGFCQVFIGDRELAEFYDRNYFLGEKANFSQLEGREIKKSYVYWLNKFLPAPTSLPLKVLEIGPGLGGMIGKYLNSVRPDIQYEAIELSDFASEKLRSIGLTVHTGSVYDPVILEKCRSQFDIIIGNEVIEHDPNPHFFVESVSEMLKPGGICRFTTGNIDGWMARLKKTNWYYMDPPAHVSYFTPVSAKRLFSDHGFKDVTIWKVGFQYIDFHLKYRIGGFLALAHYLNLPTGMTISASKSIAPDSVG
jgi:SAM-dependent methyltransferase